MENARKLFLVGMGWPVRWNGDRARFVQKAKQWQIGEQLA
jgi:hypothetical protein